MNYFEIGQRVRKYRKAHGLSQEQLAEKINISTTHMSHIETGNTKLSLPVFVRIAEVLEIQTDDLLYDKNEKAGRSLDELMEILDQCSAKEVRIITDIAKATKIALDKHNP